MKRREFVFILGGEWATFARAQERQIKRALIGVRAK
jgi:hypothetical protein